MLNRLNKFKIVVFVIFILLILSTFLTFIILRDRHTVSFNSNGGTEVPSYNYVVNNSTIKEPLEPSKTGYVFDGWYYNDELFDFQNFKIESDITLVAHWSLINYSITYVFPEYSTNPNTIKSYNILQTVDLNPAIANNLTFMGWYNNQNFDGIPITEINKGSYGNVVLYAKFKNIDMNLNGYKIIAETEDLNLLRIFPYDNYILGNDIDLNNNSSFTPIKKFGGILDGNGFKIKNLNIIGEFTKVGLIENLIAGEIINLGIENYSIDCSSSIYVGVIASDLSEYSTISNCYTCGNLTIKSNNDVYVGGLIGYSTGSPGYTISNSFTNSNIQVISEKSAFVGGLVGYFSYTKIPNSTVYYGSIYNSYSNSSIKVETTYEASIFSTYDTNVGGLIGDSLSGTHHISNCFSMGTIDSFANKYLSSGYLAGTIAGFYNNSYCNNDMIIKENNKIVKEQASDYDKLIKDDQFSILEKLSEVWDGNKWNFTKNYPLLSLYENIHIIELSNNKK